MQYLPLGLVEGASAFPFGHTNSVALDGSVTGALSRPTLPAYTFSSAVRDSVYGPGMQTLDFALIREFTVTERARFQFRAEFFNGPNRTNLETPNRFVNTPQLGSITEAATPGRQVQLSARISL
jgi:hypothetical protein